jgi:hypothetical protein
MATNMVEQPDDGEPHINKKNTRAKTMLEDFINSVAYIQVMTMLNTVIMTTFASQQAAFKGFMLGTTSLENAMASIPVFAPQVLVTFDDHNIPRSLKNEGFQLTLKTALLLSLISMFFDFEFKIRNKIIIPNGMFTIGMSLWTLVVIYARYAWVNSSPTGVSPKVRQIIVNRLMGYLILYSGFLMMGVMIWLNPTPRDEL